MTCRQVIRRLSPYLDDRLDGEQAVRLRQHLGSCPGCRREWELLLDLRRRLGGLGRMPAPRPLRYLLQMRMRAAQRPAWRQRVRDALDVRLSVLRTLGGTWYMTRAAGTALTLLFFLAVSAAMTPGYVSLRSDGSGLTPGARYQLVISVLKNLGLTPVEAQRRPIGRQDPQIHDLYLLHFSQSASRTTADDSFSVVTVIDRSGSAKIENVLEYPADGSLLEDFNAMLATARLRPASQNGRAVDSHLVMNFSKISVYE